jgi:hypothetical protein
LTETISSLDALKANLAAIIASCALPRYSSHHMKHKGFEDMLIIGFGSEEDKQAIRWLEEELIQRSGGAQKKGGTSSNAISGVRSNNPKQNQDHQAFEERFNLILYDQK